LRGEKQKGRREVDIEITQSERRKKKVSKMGG